MRNSSVEVVGVSESVRTTKTHGECRSPKSSSGTNRRALSVTGVVEGISIVGAVTG